jgi:hypothetical protein
MLEQVSGKPWLHGRLTIEMRRIAPQIRILGLSVTTPPDDREFLRSMTKLAESTKSIDTRNLSSGKGLGQSVSTPKSVDTRKSNPCKAVTTCRRFGGLRALRASFAPLNTTKEAQYTSTSATLDRNDCNLDVDLAQQLGRGLVELVGAAELFKFFE